MEHPFGTVKFTLHGSYFLLRTRRKVCCEVALLFLSYNLKRVCKVLGFAGLMARLNRQAVTILSFYLKFRAGLSSAIVFRLKLPPALTF